jgi:hypothetical protein
VRWSWKQISHGLKKMSSCNEQIDLVKYFSSFQSYYRGFKFSFMLSQIKWCIFGIKHLSTFDTSIWYIFLKVSHYLVEIIHAYLHIIYDIDLNQVGLKRIEIQLKLAFLKIEHICIHWIIVCTRTGNVFRINEAKDLFCYSLDLTVNKYIFGKEDQWHCNLVYLSHSISGLWVEFHYVLPYPSLTHNSIKPSLISIWQYGRYLVRQETDFWRVFHNQF